MSHITPWEATREIAEEGLGLKPGIDFQQVAKLGPHVLERILPSPLARVFLVLLSLHNLSSFFNCGKRLRER